MPVLGWENGELGESWIGKRIQPLPGLDLSWAPCKGAYQWYQAWEGLGFGTHVSSVSDLRTVLRTCLKSRSKHRLVSCTCTCVSTINPRILSLLTKTRCKCSAPMSDSPLENGNEIPAWKTALSINETVCREISSEAFQRLLGGWVPLAARSSALLCWKVPLLVVVFRCRCGFGPELRQTGLSKGMLKSRGILIVQSCGKRNSARPVVGAGSA